MAKTSICSIGECRNTSIKRGYCNAHYLRWYRYGDPLAGGSYRNLSEPCSIVGCNKQSYCRGWCTKHYQRWQRFGDPNKVKLVMAEKGEPLKHLEEIIIPYQGNDCIPWPYARIPSGYGQIWLNGRLQVVSRVVCERRHGPPPAPNYDAAHSCGNGHLACSNPNHLSWKTRAENVADMIEHGTARFWGHKCRKS